MSHLGTLVFGIAGLLALVAILPPLAAKLRVPYSVLLAVVGCGLGLAIGVADRLPTEGLDRPLIEFLRSLGTIPITAEIFLWIFLPLLLFETAVNLDARELLDDLGPILVLAIVAVLLCTAMAGAALWMTTPFGLLGCLLVASIIATTDPAAVVAVFREVGAPRRLVTLVEGESLLNDAAAIAIFGTLLTAVAARTDVDPEGVLVEFAYDFLGGVALGAILGRLAGLLVSRVDQGGPAEVTLSVALAYLAYAISEAYFHVSGVVAVVIAGLVFGTIGRTRVAQREWQSVRVIWSQMGFWASSLIFLFASMLVPDTLGTATLADLAALGILIAGALVARALTLFGLLPIVQRVFKGRPISSHYKAVILWGGLRGAVTLALALAVSENQRVPDALQHFVSVLATGFVLFTLLIQGVTLRPLIRWFGLHRLSAGERLLRSRALDLARAEVRDELSAAAIQHGLDLEGSKVAQEILNEPEVLKELEVEPGEDMLREQIVTALVTVIARERQFYVDEIAARTITRRTGAQALKDNSALFDALKSDGFPGYRSMVRQLNELDRGTKVAAWLHRVIRLNGPLAARLALRVELFLAKRRVVEELLGFTRSRIKALFGLRVADTVERILEARLDQIDRVLDALRLQYPNHWQEALDQYLGRIAIQLEWDRFESMYREHMLSPQLFQNLVAGLRVRQRRFDRPPRLDLGLDLITMMRSVSMFERLSDERLRELRRLLRPRLALPEERIVRRGEPGDAMFFIASGAVEVILPSEPIRLGTGDFFGEMALIQRRPRTADVVALGYCQILELRRDAFRQLLRVDPELMREVRRVAEARLRGRAAGEEPSIDLPPDGVGPFTVEPSLDPEPVESAA